MKKSITLFFLLLGACCLWFGNATGPGAVQNADRTGSPLSAGGSTFCSLCHSGGSFGTEVTLTLLSEGGDTITEYVPETAYTLHVEISASGAEAYGFQAVALDANNGGVGTYGAPSAGTQVSKVAGVDYPEHSERDSDGMWDIEWTSPAVGTGAVTFYAAGNAVNSDFGASGDLANTTTLSLEEALGAGIANVDLAINLELAPNPAVDFVRIKWSADQIQPDQLHIINATGQLMQRLDLDSQREQLEIGVQDLPRGVYFVRVSSQEGIQTKRFLKI